MIENKSICIVVPVYNVGNKIVDFISSIPDYVDKIIVIDDKCPLKSGLILKKNIPENKKLNILFNENNLGVGGTVKRGYNEALKSNEDIIIKIDGDGQMDPEYINLFLKKAINESADYVKGNRFFFSKDILNMSLIRIIGNIGVSFLGKISTGYWDIFDFTNGYTLIKTQTLKKINLSQLKNNYFFETDLLYHLNLINAKVRDIYIPAKYSKVKSNLKIRKIFFYFFFYNMLNFIKRIYKKF